MPATIRVLIVDDSALIRQMLARALSMDPRVQVVGSARDGAEAIEKARELSPDVVTLDIQMPQLSGLEALPHIRKHSNARVVMLSAMDDPDTTYRALSLGAVDFIAKPSAGMASSITELSDTLLKKIKTAYRITPERAAASQLIDPVQVEQSNAEAGLPNWRHDGGGNRCSAVVAIAASTGGPPALERIFTGLTASLPASYLIVQHLPQGFSESLARRLAAISEVKVLVGSDGMEVEPGVAYIAPHGAHMIVERGAINPSIVLEQGPALHGVKPAADPLLASLADTCGSRAIGVVLTGMGSDGANGALAIRAAGGDTVVQDEATSIVWGMPQAALKLGAASRVVPLGLVAAEIRRSIRLRAEGGAV